MSQQFRFPPPPPPPRPRNEAFQTPNLWQPGYAPSGNYERGRGGNLQRGRGRGSASRGGAFPSRGRGSGGSNRGDFHNGGLNRSYSNAHHPLPYEHLSQRDSLPTNQGQKRPYTTAFNKPINRAPRPEAAPAIPSFGGDILPTATPKPSSPTAANKKPRRYNQLGLTPASQEHESSSDEDEEAKLAQDRLPKADPNPNVLQFDYKGRTATLRTAAEIAAWIAERKKNYPTAAKVEAARKEAEERKKKWGEAKRDAPETQRLHHLGKEKEQQEELRRRALESVGAAKARKPEARVAAKEHEEGEDVVARAKLKAQKLQRKLAKVQREAQKAEEAFVRMQAGARPIATAEPLRGATARAPSNPAGEATIASPPAETNGLNIPKTKLPDDDNFLPRGPNPSHGVSSSDLEGSDESDSTSSSGSSISSHLTETDPDSDADSESTPNSDSAPEEITSKRTAPDPVSLPPQGSDRPPTNGNPPEKDNPPPKLCNNMVRTGRCQFGKRCRYSHDMSQRAHGGADRERGREREKNRPAKAVGKGGRTNRKSLYQVMVEKELDEERRAVLGVIMSMGQQGMLDEPAASGDAGKDSVGGDMTAWEEGNF